MSSDDERSDKMTAIFSFLFPKRFYFVQVSASLKDQSDQKNRHWQLDKLSLHIH